MATPFLSSEEYDERAHRLYNAGDYDRALETLKEGLVLYPHCADLHVGLGYTRLAREEFAWARQSFETAIALEPDHEDALVGLGEVLLRLGRKEEALELFERVRRGAGAADLERLLSMGRALPGRSLRGRAASSSRPRSRPGQRRCPRGRLHAPLPGRMGAARRAASRCGSTRTSMKRGSTSGTSSTRRASSRPRSDSSSESRRPSTGIRWRSGASWS